MRLREQVELYWRVSIIQYVGAHGRLVIDIQDYAPEDVTSFFTQKPKSPVAYLEFSKIRWPELAPHLSSYRKSAFEHLLEPEAMVHIAPPSIVQRTGDWFHAQNNRVVQVTFHVPFNKAQFVNGGAGKMHQPQHKILFTAHPQFGFVFQLQGQSLMHFVWELLDSNATYLWSYDPHSIPHNLACRKLEYALSSIRAQGRQAYRFGMEDNMGVSGLYFHVIRHDKISSSHFDSFPIWRARLHERLA